MKQVVPPSPSASTPEIPHEFEEDTSKCPTSDFPKLSTPETSKSFTDKPQITHSSSSSSSSSKSALEFQKEAIEAPKHYSPQPPLSSSPAFSKSSETEQLKSHSPETKEDSDLESQTFDGNKETDIGHQLKAPTPDLLKETTPENHKTLTADDSAKSLLEKVSEHSPTTTFSKNQTTTTDLDAEHTKELITDKPTLNINEFHQEATLEPPTHISLEPGKTPTPEPNNKQILVHEEEHKPELSGNLDADALDVPTKSTPEPSSDAIFKKDETEISENKVFVSAKESSAKASPESPVENNPVSLSEISNDSVPKTLSELTSVVTPESSPVLTPSSKLLANSPDETSFKHQNLSSVDPFIPSKVESESPQIPTPDLSKNEDTEPCIDPVTGPSDVVL